MKKIFVQRWFIISFIFVLLFLDQLSKFIVKTSMLLYEMIPVCGTWFNIRFIENLGAAYGLELGGDYGKMLLSLLRIVLVVFLSVYIHRQVKKGASTGVILGFSLILVGALGNIVDSLFYGMLFSASTPYEVAQFLPAAGGYGTFLHGAVVDMLYFPIIDTTLPSWVPFMGGDEFIFFSPVFNLADTYISVGFLYLLIFKYKYFNSEPKSAA